MVIINIIVGILMIICGGSVIANPFQGAYTIYWLVSAFMLLAGVGSIIHFIEAKNAENVAKKFGVSFFKTGVGSLIFGIAAVVLAILSMSSVIGFEIMVRIIVSLFGLWTIIDGVSYIISGIGMKKLAMSGWIAMLVMGILLAIAGIACIVHIFVGLEVIGTLFGVSMLMAGFALLFS